MAFDIFQFVPDWGTAGKILGGPAAGAVVGWLISRKQRKNAEVQASADQTDAITRRFESLMDGYENRIKDLLSEVQRLRELIVQLQQQISHGVK